MADDITYVNALSGDEIMQYIPPRERWELKEGQTIKAYVRGEGNYYYKIVGIEGDYHTKVSLKRIYLHYSDLIKIAILIGVGYWVIKRYADFLLPS